MKRFSAKESEDEEGGRAARRAIVYKQDYEAGSALILPQRATRRPLRSHAVRRQFFASKQPRHRS